MVSKERIEDLEGKLVSEDGFVYDSNILSSISAHIGTVGFGIGIRAIRKIHSWVYNNDIVEHERPWNNTYIGMAHMLARRSHDSQTQCGCIITTADHKPLGMGYNGFPAGIPDNFLPNTRPEKYPWMIHAELNAILNCTGKPKGGIAFVTGHPCLHCLMCLCQVGITNVIYDVNHSIHMINEQEETNLEIMKWLAAEKISVVGYDYKGNTGECS